MNQILEYNLFCCDNIHYLLVLIGRLMLFWLINVKKWPFPGYQLIFDYIIETFNYIIKNIDYIIENGSINVEFSSIIIDLFGFKLYCRSVIGIWLKLDHFWMTNPIVWNQIIWPNWLGSPNGLSLLHCLTELVLYLWYTVSKGTSHSCVT